MIDRRKNDDVQWLLRTTAYRPDGVFSELYNGSDLFCVTCEHAYQNDAAWVPKIPRGATYTCKRGMHNLVTYNKGQPFETFEIIGIAGHTGLLFHPGNFNRDSNGCVLVGKELRQQLPEWWVTNSRDMFADFMKALEGVDEFSLRVE